MSLSSIASQCRAFVARIPAGMVYWRQHGLRALLIEAFDLYVRRPHQESLESASRWQDEAQFSRIPSATDATPLVKPLVLIIANLNLQQCRKYRVLQKIEQLRDVHDIDVVISSYTDTPRAMDLMQLATSVLFYRVPDGDNFRSFCTEAARLGIPTCYDIDDPIFSRSILTANANLQTLPQTVANNILNDADVYQSAMKACDICTVSTPGLVSAASETLSSPAFLWRNAIDAESTHIAADIAQPAGQLEASAGAADGLTITYMSGSKAHDQDFSFIAGALATIFSRHQHATLRIMGHANLPQELQSFKQQIKTLPFASYRYYFKQLMDADIIVIPLLQDPFNECKSAIRLLESSIVGTPCVVSPVGDFCNIARHRETAMVASTADDWVQSLDELIQSAALRKHIGQQSRDELSRHYAAARIAEELDETVIQVLRGQSL